MFNTSINKDDGITTIRCAVTDREHVFKTGDTASRKNAETAAEQMQNQILHKLGFDPKKKLPLSAYRNAYAAYQTGRGK